MLLADDLAKPSKYVGSFNITIVEVGKYASFEGFFSDLNIWNSSLSDLDILNYSLKKDTPLSNQADVLNWTSAKINTPTAHVLIPPKSKQAA